MFEPALALASDESIVQAIKRYQDIQKRLPPASNQWQYASEQLGPLFNEMHLRHPGHWPSVRL